MASKYKSDKKNSSQYSLLGKIVIMIVVAELAGIIGAVFTFPAIGSWYAGLAKPCFTPPSWVFGPAWTLLYVLMGTAAGLVWHTKKTAQRQVALKFYVVQLALNVLWSLLFFGLHSPLFALAEIGVLWITIVFTIKAFYPVAKNAAWLMIPYILWVTFAAALTAGVWLLNAA